MRKAFLLLILIFNFAHADYLFQYYNVCIKSYSFKDGNIYFTYSDTGETVIGTTKSLADDIFDGYEYNATTRECKKATSNNSLGLPNDTYSSYMAGTGLLVGMLLSSFVFLALRLSL